MNIAINREISLKACKDMQAFYHGLDSLYETNGISLESNRGRRNVLMSGPMEKFLADATKDLAVDNPAFDYAHVTSDGKTGEPDIVITKKDGTKHEIECKLTSPHQSSGSITFQTDHDTLKNKGKLDYIYIIAGGKFDQFCVLYFKDLTIDDFRGLSPGARGKVQMYKHKGMKKCTVLVGNAVSSSTTKLQKLIKETGQKIASKRNQVEAWKSELAGLSEGQNYNRKQLLKKINNGETYIKELLNKSTQKSIIINQQNASYSFEYETLKEINDEITSITNRKAS